MAAHDGRTCDELEQYIFMTENEGKEKDVAALFDRTQLGEYIIGQFCFTKVVLRRKFIIVIIINLFFVDQR